MTRKYLSTIFVTGLIAAHAAQASHYQTEAEQRAPMAQHSDGVVRGVLWATVNQKPYLCPPHLLEDTSLGLLSDLTLIYQGPEREEFIKTLSNFYVEKSFLYYRERGVPRITFHDSYSNNYDDIPNHLKDAQSVNLGENRHVSVDLLVRTLACFPVMTSLDLFSTKVHGRDWPSILQKVNRSYPNMRELSLSSTPDMTVEGIKALTSLFPNLEVFNLSIYNVELDVLQNLRGFPRLRKLLLNGFPWNPPKSDVISNAFLVTIRDNCPNLNELYLLGRGAL